MKKTGFRAAVAAVAMLLIASCGGGGSSGSTPAPGHGSPAAAVMGLIRALSAHNMTAACGYFIPSAQSQCSGAQLPPATGSVTIGHTAVNGDRALVVVMSSKFCLQNQCLKNSDPNKGLPGGSTTFDQAYTESQQSNNDPTTPCQRVDGKWYVAG